MLTAISRPRSLRHEHNGAHSTYVNMHTSTGPRALSLARSLALSGARSLSRARSHTYADIHTHLNTQVFLDSAVTVKLLSDKCTIRFLPARRDIFPSPRDYEVSALKAKVALQKHSDITLSLNTCDAENSIIVSNGLPVDVRYKTYFCNIALLVPADFILPSTVIEDFNGFSTQVRPRVMRALTSLRVLRTQARARRIEEMNDV